MEAKKIFVVTSGCYSDYGISSVYSTREAAEKSIEGQKDDDGYGFRVEEFVLDPEERLREGYKGYDILMLRDGTTESIEESDYLACECELWERSNASYYKGTNTPDVLRVRVAAKSQEHAVKIANEKRAMMIATNQWK